MNAAGIPYLDVAISDEWFCYRCGESGVYYDRVAHKKHDVIKHRQVIFPDSFIGPLYMSDTGKVSIEQCTIYLTSEYNGYQFILNLPKNWFALARYVINSRENVVMDADLTPVGASDAYVECLLSGTAYVPDGNA